MDVVGRDELEQGLARILARHGRNTVSALMAALGDPPDLANVPFEFWQRYDTELQAELSTYLQKAFARQALLMLAELPAFGVEWALFNEVAASWASRYSFDLVRGISANTRQALQRIIAGAYERGVTRGQVEDLIKPLFGPVRAEMIAVTEVTRATTEGERALAAELAKQGISMTPIWQTNNDELVCTVCAPRNGREITDSLYPPAHPRCRCWTNHQLPEVRA